MHKSLEGGTADRATALALIQHYGELDGEIIYHLANRFAAVDQSLTGDQKAQPEAMRTELLGELSHPSGAHLDSQGIPMPEIPDTDFLFAGQ